jgi:DNA-binding GntR family transcriptional regulator
MNAVVGQQHGSPRRSALTGTTLAETIYNDIRGRLQRGEIAPDSRLLDHEIAARYQCTRTPVRQALLRLVSESHLAGTTRGFVIPQRNKQDIREIFELRQLLEPYAAASAVEHITPKQKLDMRRAFKNANAAMKAADPDAVTEAIGRFRAAWLDAVKSERLKSAIQTFSDHAQQVRDITLRAPGALHAALACQSEVLDGFASNDKKLVQRAMEKLVKSAESFYFASADRP